MYWGKAPCLAAATSSPATNCFTPGIVSVTDFWTELDLHNELAGAIPSNDCIGVPIAPKGKDGK